MPTNGKVERINQQNNPRERKKVLEGKKPFVGFYICINWVISSFYRCLQYFQSKWKSVFYSALILPIPLLNLFADNSTLWCSIFHVICSMVASYQMFHVWFSTLYFTFYDCCYSHIRYLKKQKSIRENAKKKIERRTAKKEKIVG